MAKLLIAGEDVAMNARIAAGLRLMGYDCDEMADSGGAADLAQSAAYDLLVLDAAPPKPGEPPLCSRLPAGQPVIFLVEREGLPEKLQALGVGADDYLVKPFAVPELTARVSGVLQRTRRGGSEFLFKDLRIDMAARRVWRGGREVELTPREYSLLAVLVVRRNLALSRSQLLALAWGYEYVGESRTVDVHINRLRRKLGLEQEIQTVFKIGYRLNTRGIL